MKHPRTPEAGGLFIKRFPSDPEFIRNVADIEAVEKISASERFPCNSPNEALATVSEYCPEATAITYLPNGSVHDKPLQWTYRQYRQQVVRAANLFHALGLASNESVVLLLPNVPEMLFALWGAQAAGIAAPINWFLEPEKIAGIAAHADAKIIVTLGSAEPNGEELFEKAQLIRKTVTNIEHLIVVGDHDKPDEEGVLRWQEAVAKQPGDNLIFDRELTGKEIASYFHTGGTTGTPKLAQHSQRGEMVNLCQMMMASPDRSAEQVAGARTVALCALPMFHVNAVFTMALAAIAQCGEIVIAGPLGFRNKQMLEQTWALVERYKVSYFSGVPTVYSALLELDPSKYDTSSLDYVNCGASPMPRSLLNAFREHTGADIMEGYGMTETTAGAICHFCYGDRKVGSIGMRIPYQKVRVVILNDESGIERDCDTNEVGCLLHSGPNLMIGYKKAEVDREAWPAPGWLNSGDLGRVDETGYFWLAGRAKDLIIRGGHNIDPLITEDALCSHPAVAFAAAIGKPDVHAGEVPIAYVQLIPGEQVSATKLQSWAKEHVAERAAAPVEVILRDALEITAIGKVLKPGLRADAIARAYLEICRQTCPDVEFSAEVNDSKSGGHMISLKTQGTSLTDEQITQSLQSSPLQKLFHEWELVA